ncbi:S-layer homology domain-containing protein [Clostridium fessum]|uniref:S-layer homology domain-containing protein n=1 Tax=Clostridium fessum TaxID=2126740 RepID=UPI0022E897C3|nr:S-layer homology domain-containing protein [Clostridium fessum]
MIWKWKRPAAFLLAAAMIFTMPGVPASAVEAGASAVHTGLCEHHPKHTEDCGYTEGTEGAACEHEHTEDCYTLVEKCIHKHDESCYPVLEGSVSENTATPSEAEEAQPIACTHKCSEESGCITKELSCPHEHDDTCGYIPATEGTPCRYTCEQCNSQDSGLVPGVSGNAPVECICETRCEKEEVNSDCPVCSAEDADLSACKGTAEAACICEKLCGADAVNPECTVCSAKGADLSACLGKEEAVLAVQALIDALPETVTEDNATEIEEQLKTIDAEIKALTDEQAAKLDMTRYNAVCAALAAFALPQADHTHCVCGGNGDVNGHEHDTAGTEWTTTDSLPDSVGNYYLTKSVSENWTVPTDGEVNLCLNGQTINGKITVGSGATLTLTDCSDSGRVQGEVLVNGGKLELYSGTITGGVQVGKKGADYQTGSSFTMYGGAITGNEDYGGVFLVGTTNHIDPPSFTMHGGTISDNTAGASDGGGGGVYVGEKCSFTMDGGTITGNTATAGNGGGIYIHFNAGNVSISNATITGNKASATGDTRYGHGGGIYSERGVTVKNVTITGNNSTFAGGGIYGKGAITLTDATVTDNNQYDVYYDGTESTNPKLTVSGSVKAGYYANYDWKLPILVSGALSEDSVIRVGVREGINPGAIAEPASGVTLSAENFKADAADSVTSLGNDGKVYLVPCTHEMDDTGYTCKKCKTQFDARVGDSAYYKTLTDAFNAARGSTVTLLRNVTLTGNCSSENYSATLDLNGKTVSTENKYIHVGGGNKSNTLTVKDSSKGGGTQALNVKFSVGSNGTLAVDDSYTGEISRVELQAGGALERFGGKIGELVLSNAAYGSTSTGYVLKLWKGNTNACTIGKITDNTKSKSLTVNDLLGTDYAKCELYGEKDGAWSIVPKTEKISELTGYTAYKVQFTECVHQCADDSNPVCSVCHKDLYTKITAKAADGTTKTAYFTEDSALENGYVEAIQTLNGWSNEGCTEPTLTLLRDMPYGTSITLTGMLTLEGGTHTASNVTVAENANVTFASGSYKGATINGTATVEAGVTFTTASVTVNGTLNAKGGTFNGPVKFNGSSIANISGGSFNNEKKYGGVEFDYNVTGTISGGTFVFADFYTTKVKLSGGTFTMIKTNGDRKLADLLAEGAAYYGASDNQAVTNDSVNTLENVKVVSHTHDGGKDGKGTCSICGKQMAASLTVGDKTSWYTAFASAIEAANAADGEKTITLYQDVNGYAGGQSTTYELTNGPVTLATGGKSVTRANLTAKGISLTVTGSNGGFNVSVDGKDAELTVNDKDTRLAIVTAQNGGKLSLSNGTFSRVAVKDGSSASLSGGSYGEITSDAGYVKPYALLAKGYAYKKTKDNQWLPNANSIPSEVTVEKAPFAVEKIYPNNDTNYTENSAFTTDGNITLTAVIAPETEGVTYYYWWERFDESSKDWTTKLNDVNTATHTGGQSKTLTISGLPVDKSYQYHIYVQCSNGYNCYSEPFTVTRHQHSWTYTASDATITAKCSQDDASGGSVTIAAPAELTYNGSGKPATVTASRDWQGPAVDKITISYTKTGKYGPEKLENDALPTNAGTYTASITMGSATASVTYTIGKATPKAEDFTFTAPTSLTYDGNVKSATVSPAKAGTGEVIVKYYDKDGQEATPKNAGEYTVKIDVTESTNYAAANGLTADSWKFSITKAAAPTMQPIELTVINGLAKTYLVNLPALPMLGDNCKYGSIKYEACNFNLIGEGGYANSTAMITSNDEFQLTVPAVESQTEGSVGTVGVKITTDNYQDMLLTVKVIAKNKIVPVLDGEITATPITFGQILRVSTITGTMKDDGKTVEGTFEWTNPSTKPDKAGDYQAEWIFTPAEGYEEYATATGTVTIKVNKATPTFNAPTAQENLTYTGQEQALITAGSVTSGGTMQYSLTENGTYSPDIPTGTDAGAYTVWYRVIGDANHKDPAPASVEVSIGKKPLTIAGVTAASKPYDGMTNADISSVTFDNVTLNRGTDYTVTANFDDAGVGNGKNITATVTLMGQAAKNYALEQSSFTTTGNIIKAAAPDFAKETGLVIVNGHEKTYTVTLPALPTLETPKEYGALTYEIGGITLDGSYYTDGAKVENGKLTLPIQKNDVETTGSVGTVTVVIKSTNYEDITLTVNVNATNKLVPTVTAPTVNTLTYNGAEQALVTAGKTTGGTMLYRLGDSEWSEQIPTAKNAGEYTVWYKVQGNAEYADVPEQNVTVTVAKKVITVTALDQSAYTGSTAPDLSSPEADKDYKMEGLVGADTLSGTVTLDYAQTPDMSKTGETAINITGTLSNDNYEITYVSGTLTVSKQSSSDGGSSSGGSGSGGGSSSGGSNGSGSNDNTNQPEAPVTGETKPIQPDKNGNAAVDNSSVQSAIDKAKQDAKKNGTAENRIAVTVPITSAARQTSFNVTIKAQTLDLLVKENVRQFTVATDHLVSVTIGLDTLKQLDTASAGGDIILRADKVDALRSTEAKATIGTRPAYDLSLVYLSGGKETPIANLNGHTISVRLPYTPAKSEQTGNLYAVYVDDAGKVEWITKSSYNASLKAVVFETGHFSVYGVGYKTFVPAFTDITGHWAADNILFAASRGLLSGTSDTTFSPGTGMTRGMFVTALGRLAGINPDSYQTGKFTDVKADAYYAPYVNWAAQTGIVEGVTATTFAPDTNINREQMAVIMKNYAAKLGHDLPQTLKAVTFADNTQISSWAKDAVKSMQQAGILAGKNENKFDPKGTATRAEVATVLRRFVEIVIDPQAANGWQQNDSGQWNYYRNGESVKGWLSEDQKWYWLDKVTGMMFAGGWKQIDGKWYYFYADGTMAVNTASDR